MPKYAVRVQNISKKYYIHEGKESYQTIRSAISNFVSSPVKRVKNMLKRESNPHIWALNNVSFDLEHGEVIGIIGPNGAGKSTLLKILSRITAPTKGKIELYGRVGSLLEVGTGFHPELTGRENIYLNGAILGMTRKEIQRKFDEIVEFAEITEYLDTPIKYYSSGMSVRLAFAVASHLEPEILVVDEVLAVGDAAFQKKSLGKMDEVSSEGRTVMFVSHNMGLIRSLCSRAILLNKGVVILDSDVETVIEEYLSNKDDEGQMGELTWEEGSAYGNAAIKLLALRLYSDGSRQPRITFDIEKPINIEFDYKIYKSIRGIRFIVSVIAQDGTLVFATTDHRERESILLPGVYRSKCVIPGRLLNRGKYYIRLSSGVPGVGKIIKTNEILHFFVEGQEASGTYFPERWPGVIAPEIEWVIDEKIE